MNDDYTIPPSRTICYKNGNKAFETLTVKELITFLSHLPPYLAIGATWEGTDHGICSAELNVVDYDEPVLFLDVEWS